MVKGRFPLPSLKMSAEELAIALVETEESNLQIVLLIVGCEGWLAPRRRWRRGSRWWPWGCRSGLLHVVAAVVVVEGRDRGQEMRIEGMQPGEQDADISLSLAVAKSDAGVLRGKAVGRNRSVLDVVGIRIVRDLVSSRGAVRSSDGAGWKD